MCLVYAENYFQYSQKIRFISQKNKMHYINAIQLHNIRHNHIISLKSRTAYSNGRTYQPYAYAYHIYTHNHID